ncbi:hypothetical protein O1611_g2109 [Lasiodiplodia mahajangana]|uniref:Uncharacterized protein n=1 Tax=Lasiodiplodia mahajangana TaxID=1108764 RepID=A0ACC2JW76_9PEZI|nr:hypothetical protein O1611_g2109 [Lasiodiplodia mahajangana]
MSDTIQTSRIGSPLSDLRPAPLRIPLRKKPAGLNAIDSKIVAAECEGTVGDTQTTTPSRQDSVQHSQSDISRSFLCRRNPGPRLESLVSRFETLDAVNGDDTRVYQHLNSSYKATTPASRLSLLPNLISHSPIESRRRASSGSSPRRIKTSTPSNNKLMLPASTHHITTIPNAIARGCFNDNCNSTCPPALDDDEKDMDADDERTSHPSSSYFTSHSTASSINRRPGALSMYRISHSSSETPSIIHNIERRLSVADLRQSFEKISQAVEAPGGSARPSFQSKSPSHTVQTSQDMPSLTGSKPSLRPERSSMLPVRTSYQRPPLFGRGRIIYVGPKAKLTEQPLPVQPAGDSSKDEPKSYLPKIPQCSSQEALLEETKISNARMKLELPPHLLHEEAQKEERSNMDFEISLDGLGSGLFCEKRNDEASADSPNGQRELFIRKTSSSQGPLKIFNSPEAVSLGRRPIHSRGKVSQLRRLFERSSGRFSSPLSFMSFRSRLDSEDLTSEPTGDCVSPSWNESVSPSSTHTIARKRSMVPSLTTEISVNDFFCDFVSGANHEESSVMGSPSEMAANIELQMKPESPVKHRIRQFEHLSRDSLKVGGTADQRRKGHDNEPSRASKNEKKRDDKNSTVASWIPTHQKGAAIWRKISSSLSRSVGSWKDCNGEHEHANPTASTRSNTSVDRSSSLANDSTCHPRRSSSFGYSMYRVPHSSRHFMPTSRTTPNMQLGMSDSSNSHPKRTLNASSGPSRPETPPLSHKSFPTITSMSSGLGQFGWFGLDGHFISKPVLDEDFRPSEATVSGLVTPKGDPNALHKVVQKQSAVERSRRRRDEKHERCDKKLRSLARWKGRSKTPGSAGSAVPEEEVSERHSRGKGKGKEKETVEKESTKIEGQAPKGSENRTNKKTESGFVVFESKDVKLRHPKPRRPGQVRKVANMYRDKGSSGASVNTKMSSGATLKEGRQSFKRKASSALALHRRKGNNASA